jgi:hypothetical protein
MLTKEDAKTRILSEWRSWCESVEDGRRNARDGLLFFAFLQRERSHLLQFRDHGDKWQTIHGWLKNAGFVMD